MMRQNIRYAGIRNMFGYGTIDPSDNYGRLHFPERLPAWQVIEFLSSASVLASAELSNIKTCEPSERAAELKRAAVRVEFNNRDMGPMIVAGELEKKFNPAAAPWSANYAGPIKSQDDASLYVVTEEWTPSTTYEFLGSADDISTINPVHDLGNLHFTIPEDDNAACDRIARNYAAYIADFVRREFDF